MAQMRRAAMSATPLSGDKRMGGPAFSKPGIVGRIDPEQAAAAAQGRQHLHAANSVKKIGSERGAATVGSF